MSWIVRVALLMCLVFPIYSYSLYGLAAEWGPAKTFMFFKTVKIDRITGEVTNLTTDAATIGFSGASQGISAFDEEEGRLLYVSVPGKGPVRASNVVNKEILPSLALSTDIDYIYGLTYDNEHHKLYVLYQEDSWFFVLEVGALTARYVVEQFRSTANWSPLAAMDTKSGTYYMITGVGITKRPVYEISAVDVATGHIVRTVRVDNQACPDAFMFVEYDNITDTLMGGGRSATSNSGWFFFRVDPKTGRCSKRDLAIPEMVMNWAYDSRSQELLYIQDDTAGQKLGTFNVRTGRLGTPILLRGVFYIAAMEVSLFH